MRVSNLEPAAQPATSTPVGNPAQELQFDIDRRHQELRDIRPCDRLDELEFAVAAHGVESRAVEVGRAGERVVRKNDVQRSLVDLVQEG
jgi:hypothetical protein